MPNTPKTIKKGDDIMLFIPVVVGNTTTYKSIAYATNHTLTLSAETVDVNSKDHGEWGSTTVNKINWTVNTENLYTDEDFDMLFELMLNKTPIKIVFGAKAEANTVIVADGDAENYTPANGDATHTNAYMKEGNAIITSLTANTPSGDNATFTAEFQGTGALTKQAPKS